MIISFDALADKANAGLAQGFRSTHSIITKEIAKTVECLQRTTGHNTVDSFSEFMIRSAKPCEVAKLTSDLEKWGAYFTTLSQAIKNRYVEANSEDQTDTNCKDNMDNWLEESINERFHKRDSAIVDEMLSAYNEYLEADLSNSLKSQISQIKREQAKG